MTSFQKADAARANGAKSRGPRTQKGKAKSSRNSMKLGLSLPIILGPSDRRFYDDLMDLLRGYGADLDMKSAAESAAHNLLNLRRIRQAKRVAMRQASATFDQHEAFNKAIRLAVSCIRYEGRAFSKWRKATRRLSEAYPKLTERTEAGRAKCKS
jgi:hypothetical protein